MTRDELAGHFCGEGMASSCSGLELLHVAAADRRLVGAPKRRIRDASPGRLPGNPGWETMTEGLRSIANGLSSWNRALQPHCRRSGRR
jgi:hypothetical protein